MQDARGIGTYLHAGADLAQFGGLLENLDLEASTPKRQRCHEASNAAPDYNDSHKNHSPHDHCEDYCHTIGIPRESRSDRGRPNFHIWCI